MAWGVQKIKYLFYVVDFILAVCGLAVLIIGICTRANSVQISGVGGTTVTEGVDALIAFGSVMLVLAFIGAWGAMRENYCMLYLYTAGLFVLMPVQIGIGVSVLIRSRRFSVEALTLHNQYQKIFESYWDEPLVATVIDSLQAGLFCCGIDGAIDFPKYKKNVPGSCCGKISGNICSLTESFTVGCAGRLEDMMVWNGTIFSAVVISVAIFEIAIISISVELAKTIKKARQVGGAGQVFSRSA